MLSKVKLEQWFNKVSHSQMEDRFCDAIAVAKQSQTRRLLFKLYQELSSKYSSYHQRMALEKLVGPLDAIEDWMEETCLEPMPDIILDKIFGESSRNIEDDFNNLDWDNE